MLLMARKDIYAKWPIVTSSICIKDLYKIYISLLDLYKDLISSIILFNTKSPKMKEMVDTQHEYVM